MAGTKKKDEAPARLTLQDIKAAVNPEGEDVPVPQWGGNVRMKPLSSTQMRLLSADLERDETTNVPVDEEEYTFRLIAATIVDPPMATWQHPDGTEAEPGEGIVAEITDKTMELLRAQPGGVIATLLGNVNRINGLGVRAGTFLRR